MITISQTRVREFGHFILPTHIMEPLAALEFMVRWDLGCAGEITDADPAGTRLTIVSGPPDCLDTTIYQGSAEEMAILNQTVHFYLLACQEQDTVIDGVLADLARVPDGRGSVPFYINLLAPMVMGRNRLALATMFAIGITNARDISAGMQMNLRDLMAAYGLMQENPGMTLVEIAA